jgi:hypothetical protein
MPGKFCVGQIIRFSAHIRGGSATLCLVRIVDLPFGFRPHSYLLIHGHLTGFVNVQFKAAAIPLGESATMISIAATVRNKS